MKTNFVTWLKYFRDNSSNTLIISPTKFTDIVFSPQIIVSMQDFQIGESSEGKHLKEFAEEFGTAQNIPEYPEIIKYFIAEENRHSAYLANILNSHNLPFNQKSFTDNVFRFLRNLGGLEISLRVLVTAEIIAKLYYKSLKKVLNHEYISLLCDRIIEEEIIHVRFQSEVLNDINNAKHPVFQVVTRILHEGFVIVVSMYVWFKHYAVLSHEYSLQSFVLSIWLLFIQDMHTQRPTENKRLVAAI